MLDNNETIEIEKMHDKKGVLENFKSLIEIFRNIIFKIINFESFSKSNRIWQNMILKRFAYSNIYIDILKKIV